MISRSAPVAGSAAWPGSMGPPVTKIVGRSSRAAAISIPGTILSHEQSITMPSKRLASTISSTDAAITSRSGRIECIPLPWAMPSHGATVLNSAAAPPASRTPSFTHAASSRRWKWPGSTSLHELTIPISGFSKSSSPNPIERYNARGYAPATPSNTPRPRMRSPF